ncbi:MAG: heme ABC transporter permease [Proteobacteria bacterium]|nr:heme ABC transporter permease [Pseudomonadota bacterium]
MWALLYKLASPKTFYQWSRPLMYGFALLTIVFLTIGIFSGLFLAPADYQQGDAFRIIYIHVPSAFMSLFVYAIMSFCALLIVVWKFKMADVVIKAAAPLGASFTLLALVTGSIWGKPMWGTWWIWDARLTSELILLFLYVGVMALQTSLKNKPRSEVIVAIMVLIGFVDIPIVHYSVSWWNTLHQGATILKFAKPSISSNMLYPLLIMLMAFISYFVTMMLYRTRTEILWRERKSTWIKNVLGDL